MQFKVGGLVPWRGQVYRVAWKVTGKDGTYYRLVDLVKGEGSVDRDSVLHEAVLEAIKSMARYAVNDRFQNQIGRGNIWVKERKWDARTGTVLYRLNDYWDEGRWHTWVTQEELARYPLLGKGMSDGLPDTSATEGQPHSEESRVTDP